MDANLVRVLDLTQEIQRQLGPLARQARTARKASLIQARVRDAKARLLADGASGRARTPRGVRPVGREGGRAPTGPGNPDRGLIRVELEEEGEDAGAGPG